jgi:hypothetical protein
MSTVTIPWNTNFEKKKQEFVTIHFEYETPVCDGYV